MVGVRCVCGCVDQTHWVSVLFMFFPDLFALNNQVGSVFLPLMFLSFSVCAFLESLPTRSQSESSFTLSVRWVGERRGSPLRSTLPGLYLEVVPGKSGVFGRHLSIGLDHLASTYLWSFNQGALSWHLEGSRPDPVPSRRRALSRASPVFPSSPGAGDLRQGKQAKTEGCSWRVGTSPFAVCRGAP
jgi:hypothetical protein